MLTFYGHIQEEREPNFLYVRVDSSKFKSTCCAVALTGKEQHCLKRADLYRLLEAH